MQRIAFFTFGVVCHAMFLGVFLYLWGFVGDVGVPKSINAPAAVVPPVAAVAIDLLLLAAFAAPHSVMARPAFKRWWTRFVPQPIERSVYVLVSNVLVIALLALWQPLPHVVWDVQVPAARGALWGLFVGGWLLVPVASLMINHFDLFGTRQVWLHLRGRAYEPPPFRTPMLYRAVRHPLYVGWIVAFWATPTMTVGHLLFAAALTAYILIAVRFEERDLGEYYGDAYAAYRARVPMLIPRPGRGTIVDEHEPEPAAAA